MSVAPIAPTASEVSAPTAAHPEIVADAPAARIVRARYPRLGPPEATLRKAILHALASGLAPDPVPPVVVARERMPDPAPVLLEVHGATCLPPLATVREVVGALDAGPR